MVGARVDLGALHALFGAPIAHEDHAQRACYAALHLQQELRRYADELRLKRGLNLFVRMGLNSGEVVVGRIGDDLRMDYTAQGQTVGLAARMEQLAAPGSAYLTEQTARLVSGFFRPRDLGCFDLKGASAALRVYELEGAGALHTRIEVSRSRGFSRFVGRGGDGSPARIAKNRSMILCPSSGSTCSASSIDPFTSAKRTVTCFRSPSSALRDVRIFSARCFGVYERGDRWEGAAPAMPSSAAPPARRKAWPPTG